MKNSRVQSSCHIAYDYYSEYLNCFVDPFVNALTASVVLPALLMSKH